MESAHQHHLPVWILNFGAQHLRTSPTSPSVAAATDPNSCVKELGTSISNKNLAFVNIE